MIFVDSNVPMYLVGKAHPNRELLSEFLRSNADEAFVTSAEVYQEIIHRYVAIERRGAIEDAFEVLDALVEAVFGVEEDDVREAHRICLAQRSLSGRDCLHIAVMENRAVDTILSCDSGFDAWPGIVRMPR